MNLKFAIALAFSICVLTLSAGSARASGTNDI